jgi:hypothetical protein
MMIFGLGNNLIPGRPLIRMSMYGPILITAYQLIPPSRFSIFIVVPSHDSNLMVVLETWARCFRTLQIRNLREKENIS